MTPRNPILSVYRKELADILRDRRTVIATVAIPVLLYPILMLGFFRVVAREKIRLSSQSFVIEVDEEAAQDRLEGIIRAGAAVDGPTFDVRVGQTPAESIGKTVDVRVCAVPDAGTAPGLATLRVRLVYDEVSLRSATAMKKLRGLLQRHGERQARQRLRQMLPSTGDVASQAGLEAILEPVRITSISTASTSERGGRALGLFVPIILLVMTITGAVYPAIDLTAGERERGTLEALMATPVPRASLVIGKFLVVVTIALLSAMLNVTSMAVTMHLAGFTRSVLTELPAEIPLRLIPMIVVSMVPFAVLFSALLIAVCSFARTFREAQNYVMPLFTLAMAPAMLAALPTVELDGLMMIVPVANMVLLIRGMFHETCTWTQLAVVLLSTSLYASAAVAIAARLFGQEAVLFADAGSYRALLQRRLFRPARHPTPLQALTLAAVLFPATFLLQVGLARAAGGDLTRLLGLLTVFQFLALFALVPLSLALYFKIDVTETFRLRPPTKRGWAAGLLLGLSTWAVAHETFLVQARIMPPSEAVLEVSRQIETELASQPFWWGVLLMAIVPAVFEEVLFRGFLLSGMGSAWRKWPAILLVAAVFGAFHVTLERVPVTALLGVLLGYLCWQTRSILPCILAHALHNASMLAIARVPGLSRALGLAGADGLGSHLPAEVLIPALLVFAAALLLLRTMSFKGAPRPSRHRSIPRPSERLGPVPAG